MKKNALIIGGSGQDATEMSIFLKKKNYNVLVLDRKKNVSKAKNNLIKYKSCSLLNTVKLIKIIKSFMPDEIYNFAGISTIKESEEKILVNDKVNNYSYLALIKKLKDINFKGKLFQSLSAELFGDYNYNILNINRFNPLNPYSIAKLSSYYYSKYFRERFGLKIYCGFFFNHDSKHNKGKHLIFNIVKNFQKIVHKKNYSFKIKNILAKRDWNLATDFIQKVWSEVSRKRPSDFILRSGEYNSVEDIIMCCAKFYKISISKIEDKKRIIYINNKTNKPIIYCNKEKEKEKFKKSKNLIKDYKILRKNKLYRIIENIAF